MAEPQQIRRPVWAVKLPWEIDAMAGPIEYLTELYGPDVRMEQRGPALVAFTPGAPCNCARCDYDVARVLETTAGLNWSEQLPASVMHICPECGSKRCEVAQNHRYPCDTECEI